MMFKKIIPLCTVLALSSLPLIAQAGFVTKNYTNEDSSVRVTSGSKKPCSMDAGVYTPKQNSQGPGESNITDAMINILCVTSKNTCTANIFNGRNCEGDGQKVGVAELNLTTKKVTSVVSLDSRYVFRNDNGTVLEIKYANAGK